ncbi:branched-chain amino acid transport system II carrier protein [Selenomonas dianae]|uniref:Branched-chain amino acid transport system carrier protein n=1 Tax=Selenomonas dianae TaxID=135079 RepID=A0ABN0T510_9FIRM|nr:branched-chain amino acid transport system II carrier protein [Selenomonas dianae]WLD83543.1 branched-chain amino acid transport system II carrier protein [Selenomonas dianae]
MKRRLRKQEYIFVASLLFGLVFGAGNLIFPASMGQQASTAMLPALIGFCITGVGLPLLGIAAISITASESLFDIGMKIGRRFAYGFTCALYLCIGPLFAIPRTATVSFQVGASPFLAEDGQTLGLLLFTLLFFALVLYFSLRPSGILIWIGKVLNPLFLLFLGILIVTAMVRPMGTIWDAEPVGAYAEHAFFTGLLEGYNTMDVLAALAFGSILVNAIKRLGLSEPKDLSYSTIISGMFSTALMALIYLALTYVGAQSRTIYGLDANGGDVLAHIAAHYFGAFGGILLGITITCACLKTAIGLVTACSTTFSDLFPRSLSYPKYAVVFSLFSFAISNVGLSKIIAYSLPVLYFLYPLAIVIIALCLIEGVLGYHRPLFVWTITGTAIAAAVDFVRALPPGIRDVLYVHTIGDALPFADIGMGWVVPSLIGFAVGVMVLARQRLDSTP